MARRLLILDVERGVTYTALDTVLCMRMHRMHHFALGCHCPAPVKPNRRPGWRRRRR